MKHKQDWADKQAKVFIKRNSNIYSEHAINAKKLAEQFRRIAQKFYVKGSDFGYNHSKKFYEKILKDKGQLIYTTIKHEKDSGTHE